MDRRRIAYRFSLANKMRKTKKKTATTTYGKMLKLKSLIKSCSKWSENQMSVANEILSFARFVFAFLCARMRFGRHTLTLLDSIELWLRQYKRQIHCSTETFRSLRSLVQSFAPFTSTPLKCVAVWPQCISTLLKFVCIDIVHRLLPILSNISKRFHGCKLNFFLLFFLVLQLFKSRWKSHSHARHWISWEILFSIAAFANFNRKSTAKLNWIFTLQKKTATAAEKEKKTLKWLIMKAWKRNEAQSK